MQTFKTVPVLVELHDDWETNTQHNKVTTNTNFILEEHFMGPSNNKHKLVSSLRNFYEPKATTNTNSLYP